MADEEPLIQDNEVESVRVRIVSILFNPSIKGGIQFLKLFKSLCEGEACIDELREKVPISDDDLQGMKDIAAEKGQNAKLIEGVNVVLQSVNNED